MAIASSVIARQIDLGDAWLIEETHTDDTGGVHNWPYTPSKSIDVTAMLASHASALAARLVEQEINEVLS